MKEKEDTQRTILLVEDGAGNSLARFLSERGYVVIAAANEPAAIAVARSSETLPALMLVNLARPTAACLETARRIRRQSMLATKAPVIVVASNATMTLETKRLSLEENEYVAYFTEVDELGWLLRNIMHLN